MLLGQKIIRPRRRDAHAAEGHRPALGLPSSRLDRAGRSRDQDPRTARDHRLGKADLRQGRRRAALLRHGAGGEGRAPMSWCVDGMQGGTAATQDVFIEHVGMPTLACIRAGGAGAAGSRHAPQGAADRLGRHPQRRRRGQGAGARRRRGVDRHGGAGRARRQRSRRWEAEYQKLGTTAGAYDDWHEGKDPAGITTQDPELDEAARSRSRPAAGLPTTSRS